MKPDDRDAGLLKGICYLRLGRHEDALVCFEEFLQHAPQHVEALAEKAIALYELGKVSKHEKLYREVSGDEEDKLMPRDDAHVHLKEDEHFYSQKAFSIFVNTDEHDVEKKHIYAMNSWGTVFAQKGVFHFSWDDFDRLLHEHGDVTTGLKLAA